MGSMSLSRNRSMSMNNIRYKLSFGRNCAVSRLGRDLGFQPPADGLEHLLAIAFEHHEVAVSEDVLILQIQGFGIAARLLEECHHRLSAARGPLRHDIGDRDAL